MLKAFSRVLDAIEKVFIIALGILLAVMSGVMFYQVVLRYVFNHPNVWAEEIVVYCFAWVCFLGAPVCVRRNSHLKVDFVLEQMPPKLRAIWQAIITLVGCVFCVIVIPVSIPMVTQVLDQISLGAHVPMWIPYLSVPFGCVFMLLFGIEFFFKNMKTIVEEFKASEKEGDK